MIRSNVRRRKLSYNKLHRATKANALLRDAVFWPEHDNFYFANEKCLADKRMLRFLPVEQHLGSWLSGVGAHSADESVWRNSPTFKRGKCFIYSGNTSAGRTNLWASRKPARVRPPLDILTVHPILMERRGVATEPSPSVRLSEPESKR